MGKKDKKKQEEEKTVTAPEGNVAEAEEDVLSEPHEKDQMELTDLEMARLELHQTRMTLQTNVIDKLKFKLTIMDAEYQKNKAVVKNEMRAAEQSRIAAQRNHNEQIVEIEKRLGISMTEHTVNELGVVVHQDDCR